MEDVPTLEGAWNPRAIVALWEKNNRPRSKPYNTVGPTSHHLPPETPRN